MITREQIKKENCLRIPQQRGMLLEHFWELVSENFGTKGIDSITYIDLIPLYRWIGGYKIAFDQPSLYVGNLPDLSEKLQK